MKTMNRIALGTAALAAAIALAPAADAGHASPKAPHACSSHSSKVVAAKCADRDGDGTIEYALDGSTY